MNLDWLKTFFIVLECGSLNQAAQRLHMSQSTLTRQIQSLEQEVGGRLLERTSTGVELTAAGHEFVEGMQPVVQRMETVIQNVRRFAQGQRNIVKVGYIASAASWFLNRGLSELRNKHPEVRVHLLDLSPGEQMDLIRKRELDVALIGHAGPLLAREFYTRKLATLGVLVALPESHPLSEQRELQIVDLKSSFFVGAQESDMPGHNQWVTQICRKSGFRPQFVSDAESLSHALSTIVSENAVMLVPEYMREIQVPGVVFMPIQSSQASWEMYVAWQRGKLAPAVKTLLDTMGKK
jgi:DNA-binding transcriptional LysR family regulator